MRCRTAPEIDPRALRTGRRPAGVRVAAALGGLMAASMAARAATVAGAPPLPDAIDEPLVLAAWFDACARALGPDDRGLARVAARCPGIDWAATHGALADALPRHWASTVDDDALRDWRDLARRSVPTAARGPVLEPARVGAVLAAVAAAPAPPSWLDRVRAWLDRAFASRPEAERPDWLQRILDRLQPSPEAGRWLAGGFYALVVALVLAFLAWEGRDLLRAAWRRRRGAPRPPSSAAGFDAGAGSPGALRDRVSAAFAARLAALGAAGLVPRPRTITVAELGRLPPAPALAPVLRWAPVVERARYAPVPPPAEELAGALAALAEPRA